MKPFNPLDYHLNLLPEMFGDSAWLEHIPFAYTLIAMTRPSMLVELGVHHGDSYFAFCQGIVACGLPTRCFGVDTWKGDAHSGNYGGEVLQMLRNHHDPRFGRFSTLMQCDFDSAISRFDDGSIDLLHIDGLHTYQAVRHDYESWKAKLSRQAVVIFHDTQVRHGDFGVWKLWEELSGKFPSFEFHHGYGLGVLAHGPQPPQPILDFLAYAAQNPQAVRGYFSQVGHLVGVMRVCQMSLIHAQHHQAMINEWKRRTGQAIPPMSADLENAINHPINFLDLLTKDFQLLFKTQVKP